MKNLTFVTGNSNKANFVAQWLGSNITHKKIDVDEIQSLDVHAVSEHKARQAFAVVGSPVLVEDCSLEYHALGGFPGPLVKWFEAPGFDAMCRVLDGFTDRSATARLVYCLFNGKKPYFFEGVMHGRIADHPRQGGGFGWDSIFINDGFTVQRSCMQEQDYANTSYRKQALNALEAHLKASYA